jgi:hypothetical protein
LIDILSKIWLNCVLIVVVINRVFLNI